MLALQLLWSFLKVGILSFGAGDSLLPLIQREVVQRQGWLSMPQFTDAVAVAHTLPGPLTVKLSAFIGYQKAGLAGAFLSSLGMSLPAFALMVILATALGRYREAGWLQAALKGIKAGVLALTALAFVQLFPHTVTDSRTAAFGLALLATVLILKVNPMFMVLGAGVFGYLAFR